MKLSNLSDGKVKDWQHYCSHVIILVALIPSVSFLSTSCESSKRSNDITEIHIGHQVWMAWNFDGVTFRNGDSIPHAKSPEEWEMAGKVGKPAWCYYQNDSLTGSKYGRIYNWYAVNDPRGFSPKGWHVPTNEEWITLENFLGNSEAGLRLKCRFDAKKDGDPDRSSEFCALLGGYRGKEGGFSGIDEFTYLSTSTERDPKEDDVWGRGIHSADSTIMRCGMFKGHGLYVRLIKD